MKRRQYTPFHKDKSLWKPVYWRSHHTFPYENQCTDVVAVFSRVCCKTLFVVNWFRPTALFMSCCQIVQRVSSRFEARKIQEKHCWSTQFKLGQNCSFFTLFDDSLSLLVFLRSVPVASRLQSQRSFRLREQAGSALERASGLGGWRWSFEILYWMVNWLLINYQLPYSWFMGELQIVVFWFWWEVLVKVNKGSNLVDCMWCIYRWLKGFIIGWADFFAWRKVEEISWAQKGRKVAHLRMSTRARSATWTLLDSLVSLCFCSLFLVEDDPVATCMVRWLAGICQI